MRKLVLGIFILSVLTLVIKPEAHSQIVVEPEDVTLLPSFGTGDSLDSQALPGGGIEVVLTTTVRNNTGGTLNPGDTLLLLAEATNPNDTIQTIAFSILQDPVPDGETTILNSQPFELFEQDSFELCLIPPADTSLALCRDMFIEEPQFVGIDEYHFVEQGGSLPDDEIVFDSIPTDSTVDVHISVQNNLGQGLNQGDSITFLINMPGTDDTIQVIEGGELQSDLPDNGMATAVIAGISTLPEEDAIDVCAYPVNSDAQGVPIFTLGYVCEPSVFLDIEDEGGSTGIAQRTAESVKMYSGHDELVVETGEVSGQTNVTLFDLTGKQVYNRKANLMKNNTERFTLNELSTGMYVVQLTQSGELIKSDKVVFK